MRTIQPPEAPTYQHDQSEQFLLGGPDPGNEPWVIVDVRWRHLWRPALNFPANFHFEHGKNED